MNVQYMTISATSEADQHVRKLDDRCAHANLHSQEKIDDEDRPSTHALQ